MKEIYPVNLRTYSAKYIIFIVCFRPADFSYCWFRLWLLLQEPWRSLKKLEEAWRSFKTVAAADSSCNGWFKLRRLIQDLRLIDYLQNFYRTPAWLTRLLLTRYYTLTRHNTCFCSNKFGCNISRLCYWLLINTCFLSWLRSVRKPMEIIFLFRIGYIINKILINN